MTQEERSIHFILRYSDSLRGVDTFAEHKAIESRCGAVWWGKFGVGAAAKIIQTAQEQMAAGVRTYLYLASNRVLLYRGEILDILGGGGEGKYRPKDPSRIPTYYRKDSLALWFKVRGLRKLTKAEKVELVLYNDPSSAPQLNGMKGLIYVSRGEPTGRAKARKNAGSAIPEWSEEDFPEEF